MIFELKRFLLLAVLLAAFAQPGVAQENEADEAAAEEAGEEQEEPSVTDYISMEPAFVTHVGEPGTSLNYLKASLTLRAASTTARQALDTHMPRLRHEMVMLFGEQTDVDALASAEGQNALRQEAKKRINAVLENQRTGEQITDVLFTEFVVQR